MKIFLYFLFIIFYVSLIIIDVTYADGPILLVILYDGFRPDYLDRGITPTLRNFRDNGVYSDYLETLYPDSTGPAQRSISMGRYPSLTTYMHGLRFQKGCSLGITAEQESNWSKEYPIWIVNNLNGGISACMMWWQCDEAWASNHQIDKNFVQPWISSWTLRQRANKVIEWLNVTDAKKRPNLVMFYVEELDRITHFFGPLSRNSSLMIRRLDLLTKYIINKLMEINLYHITNIIITSDHGMRPVWSTGLIPEAKYEWKSPKLPLWDKGANMKTMGTIGRFNLMRKYSTPASEEVADGIEYIEKFHQNAKLSNFKLIRSPPYIYNDTLYTYNMEFVACPNYVLNLTRWKVDKYQNHASYYKDLSPPKLTTGPYGVHGYIRENDAIFMAKGPMLARFKKVKPFKQVDLFSAFIKLLRIQGDYERDGNFSRISAIFPIRKPIHWPEILAYIMGVAVISSIAFHLLVEYLLFQFNDE